MVNTVQSSYQERLDHARKGMIHGTDYSTKSRTCETVAGIGFGIACSQGSGDRGAIIGGTSEGFVGISVRDVTLESSQSDVISRYQGMAVLERGEMWVTPSHAVAPGDQVYFVPGTGVLTNQSSGNEIINGAVWRSTAVADALAIVYLSGFAHSS